MKLAISHPWDLSTEEAIALQKKLAKEVLAETTFDPTQVQTIAGVDVGLKGDLARAAVVVLDAANLEPVDWAVATAQIPFPYVPGLLTFQEGPSVLAALDKLTTWPDLFVFDGHGQAHPRRVGLASHLGVILDEPSIGCAKSRLTGDYEEPAEEVGAWSPLRHEEDVIGAVLRTRSSVRPVFVSTGHRVDLATAIDIILSCTKGYRLPETTRYAHKVAAGAIPKTGRGTAGRHA